MYTVALVMESTLYYGKWVLGPLLTTTQTETDTGKGNSVLIVMPRFRERQMSQFSFVYSSLRMYRKDNTELGECLSWQSTKSEDPSYTQSPIKMSSIKVGTRQESRALQ